jgi:hypothetical protein
LVWKAISSMTPMILVISVEDFSMPAMAETALVTSSPEFFAFCCVSRTASEAFSAFAAVWPTLTESCCRAAELSSTPAACCAVRSARSSEPLAITSVPRMISPDVARTEAKDVRRAATARL